MEGIRLRERALAALEQLRQEDALAATERAEQERRERGEMLSRAMERALGVRVEAAGETVTVDGLEFTIYDPPYGSPHLRLVEHCPECGMVYTRGPVYSLASLGELLQSPGQCPNPVHRPPARVKRTVHVHRVQIFRGAGYQVDMLGRRVNEFLAQLDTSGASHVRMHLSESANAEGSVLTVLVSYRVPQTVEVEAEEEGNP